MVEDAERIAAWARQGHLEAMLLHAQRLLDSGAAAEGFAWFRAAAATRDPMALNMLGRCHECGWGTPRDDRAALALFREAAEAGLDWGQYNLAGMKLRGAGTPADRAEALRWYRAAAAQGHAKALNMLGRFLEEGWHTPRDPAAARDCYRRAAEGGDFRGMANHALALREAGRLHDALHWLRRALAEGTPRFAATLRERLREAPEAALRALARDDNDFTRIAIESQSQPQ